MKKYPRTMVRCLLFIISIPALVLISCKKDNCGDPSKNFLLSNSPVVEGFDIFLEATAVQGGRFVWSGPNGWSKDYQTIASDANLQTISTVSAQASGEYRVKVYNYEGCLVSEGTTTVEIIPPPNAPCTIVANTSQSSVGGIGNYNFVSRVFSVTSSYYTVTGSASLAGGGDFLRFGFWGQTRPKPGIYNIHGGYFGDEYGTTGLWIQSGGYQFLAQDGKAYVTSNNGKLTVAVCDVKFNNPINPNNPFTVSAKITEP
jgi:hypothetical protein